jgi:hypothetical protein
MYLPRIVHVLGTQVGWRPNLVHDASRLRETRLAIREDRARIRRQGPSCSYQCACGVRLACSLEKVFVQRGAMVICVLLEVCGRVTSGRLVRARRLRAARAIPVFPVVGCPYLATAHGERTEPASHTVYLQLKVLARNSQLGRAGILRKAEDLKAAARSARMFEGRTAQ